MKEQTMMMMFIVGGMVVVVHWLSLVGASGGYSPLVVLGLLTAVASLVVEHGL